MKASLDKTTGCWTLTSESPEDVEKVGADRRSLNFIFLTGHSNFFKGEAKDQRFFCVPADTQLTFSPEALAAAAKARVKASVERSARRHLVEMREGYTRARLRMQVRHILLRHELMGGRFYPVDDTAHMHLVATP